MKYSDFINWHPVPLLLKMIKEEAVLETFGNRNIFRSATISKTEKTRKSLTGALAYLGLSKDA